MFENWKIGLLRVTVLRSQATTALPPSRFQEVFGVEADTSQVSRSAAMRTESAPFGDGLASCQVQPGRTDWVVQALHDADVMPLHNVDLNPEPFWEALPRLVADPKPVARLALGLELLCPAADRRDGYEHLRRVLPRMDIDAEGSTDFLYQINRRRRSLRHPEVEINRLSRWSVAAAAIVPLTLPPSSPVTPAEVAVRLELDINSAPEARDIAADACASLLSEFVELARELARDGDVR